MVTVIARSVLRDEAIQSVDLHSNNIKTGLPRPAKSAGLAMTKLAAPHRRIYYRLVIFNIISNRAD